MAVDYYDQKPIIGYMCRTDAECELGGAAGGNVVYASIDDLKRNMSCWKYCGVTEVEVLLKRCIIEGSDND